jgi:hypothetical protein
MMFAQRQIKHGLNVNKKSIINGMKNYDYKTFGILTKRWQNWPHSFNAVAYIPKQHMYSWRIILKCTKLFAKITKLSVNGWPKYYLKL